MNVPPYIPLPIEIPGNVTTEPYARMVGFVKRVASLHILSVWLLAAIAVYTKPLLSAEALAISCAVLLICLGIMRVACAGWRHETSLSLILFPLFIAAFGQLIGALLDAGWPVWSPAVGFAAALLYMAVCGLDLSFVAMFAIALAASAIGIWLIGARLEMPRNQIWFAEGINGAALLYFVYDLGALLSRRRIGEEIGAVIDLYRDVFNVFGYSIRVVRHWRQHRIWSK